ncbi:MAG: aminoglycoside phosphotransferase [Nitrospirae bacterium]|nr:MAG: aminoglycoside phosphotransferase [Nitrospirota bacterium]
MTTNRQAPHGERVASKSTSCMGNRSMPWGSQPIVTDPALHPIIRASGMMNPLDIASHADPPPPIVAETVRLHFPFPARAASLVPLAGDASNRRYYRLFLDDSPLPSVILMQLAEPEAFKASEEAIGTSAEPIDELPFINVHRHLSAAGITVPTLYWYDQARGLLYLEDFGDTSLLTACAKDIQHQRTWYPQAIDLLVHMQLHATHSLGHRCLALTRSFDISLFLWEFDHFLEYGIAARQGSPLATREEHRIREEFRKIVHWLASQPYVFTHRDYHSRNLMVSRGQIGVLDFQDALMGPPTYDLASLLRDSYIRLEEGIVDMLLDRYREQMMQSVSAEMQDRLLLADHEAFRRLFDFTSIQRNLKAVGRFVYIERVKHNPKFLADIPRTLAYVQNTLQKYSELHRLYELLRPYIPEWH